MRIKVNDEDVFYSTGTEEHQSDNPWIVFLHGAGMDHSVWVMPARLKFLKVFSAQHFSNYLIV